MNFILIQFIGAIGYILLTLSYFKKEKKQILFMQILSYIMFSIHYYFLNGLAGALCNFVGLFALIAIYLFDKYKIKNKKIMAIIFVIFLFVVNIKSFETIYSVFPLIASIIVIISFITDNERAIREIGIMSAVCWLIYAIVYKSYIGIVFEIITLFGVMAATIKNSKNNDLKEN